MARENTNATTEAAAAALAKAPKKFPIERLAPCYRSIFGVSASTFAGATAGLQGEYTVEEIKTRIKNWLGAKITEPKEAKK